MWVGMRPTTCDWQLLMVLPVREIAILENSWRYSFLVLLITYYLIKSLHILCSWNWYYLLQPSLMNPTILRSFHIWIHAILVHTLQHAQAWSTCTNLVQHSSCSLSFFSLSYCFFPSLGPIPLQQTVWDQLGRDTFPHSFYVPSESWESKGPQVQLHDCYLSALARGCRKWGCRDVGASRTHPADCEFQSQGSNSSSTFWDYVDALHLCTCTRISITIVCVSMMCLCAYYDAFHYV